MLILFLQQPQVILLKEGTDSSQGIPQIVSNINACGAIADAVRTTLGPRGMDKMIVDDKGQYLTKYLRGLFYEVDESFFFFFFSFSDQFNICSFRKWKTI